MATIRKGTKLHRQPRKGETPMDTTYVIERVTKQANGTYQIEARTERQRCFDRTLTGVTTWTDHALRTLIATQKLTVA
jgi:hypothetical protein